MAEVIELGAGPVNESERRIVEVLRKGLPERDRIYPNLCLRDTQSGQSYEYDVIVLTGHAFYVVEVKGWHGRIEAIDRRDWRLSSGRVVPNPLPLNEHKARVLASKIRQLDLSRFLPRRAPGRPTLRPPFVKSCLALGTDEVTLVLDPDDTAHCLTPSRLCAFLRDPSHLPWPVPVDSYRRAAPALHDLLAGTMSARADAPRRFGSYVVTSVLEQRDEQAVYLARHADFDDGRVYRIRTHSVSRYRYREDQRAQRLEALRRSAEALHRIGDHPNIVPLREYGETEDGFYEVTDWSDAGTLATTRALGTLTKASAIARIDLLRGLLEGLAAAHAQGIYHRDLRPSAVLLAQPASGHAASHGLGRPRIGDFDLAFIQGAERTVYGRAAVRVIEAHPYRAPELRHSAAYQVHESNDFYSLGRIAYDLFAGGQPEEDADGLVPRLHHVATLPRAIERPLSDLVAHLVTLDPLERPPLSEIRASLAEIRDRAAADAADAAHTQATNHDIAPGALLGDIRVLDLVAEGANKRVFRAQHELTGDVFALDVPLPDADEHGLLRAFRALERIFDRHVVRAFWLGRLDETDPARSETGGRVYLVREYLAGTTVAEHVREHGAMAPDEALDLLGQAAQALAAMHAAGVVHRDIKPDNLYRCERGVVLADFGSVLLLGPDGAPDDAPDTRPVGTPRYTPPDLADAGWGTHADVFAWGAMAYELLTGRPPWREGMPTLERAPEPWPAWPKATDGRPSVGAEVMQVMRTAMHGHASERFATGRELRDAFERARARDRERPAPPESAVQGRPTLDPATAQTSARSEATEPMPWSADWLAQLATAEHAHAFLYRSLRHHAYHAPASDERAVVDAEARAAALEAPMADTLGQLYDQLLEPLAPVPAFTPTDPDQTHSPTVVPLQPDDRVLVLPGLWLGEVPHIALWAATHEHALDESVWLAGAHDPGLAHESSDPSTVAAALAPVLGDAATSIAPSEIAVCENLDQVRQAFERTSRIVVLDLAMPASDAAADLGAVARDRCHTLGVVLDCATAATPGRLYVTSTHGVVYLGHGLGRDVAETARAVVRTRRAWADACSNGSRMGRVPDARGLARLLAPMYRPYRIAGQRLMPCGRLTWPKADHPAPSFWGHGGLSLPERLLPWLALYRADRPPE